MGKFTIVLPTRGLKNQYLPLVFRTYEKYLDLDSIEEIIIISPQQENLPDQKSSFLSDTYIDKIPVRFLSDEEILFPRTVFPDIQAKGWYRQQIIKLLIYQHVKTPVYLIVDDDLFLTRSLSYNDLRVMIDGKIYWKYSSEKYSDLGKKNYSALTWWKGSAQLLEFDQSQLRDDDHLLGVTPQIFVTEYVRNLISHLESLSPEWIEKFIQLGATEYTTYWIYLHTQNLHHVYSDKGTPLWTNDPQYNILDYCTVEAGKSIIANGFCKCPSYFMVIQSYLGYPAHEISELQQISLIPQYTDVFIVTSIINSPNTIYTPEERLQQTCQTLQSIRDKFTAPYKPYIILAEMSKLTDEQLYLLGSNVETVYDYASDVTRLGLISADKSRGELYLVCESIKEFLREHRSYQRLWKISGRYHLNEKFDLTQYLVHPMNVRINQQVTHKDVYTVLYQCSADRVGYLLRVLSNMFDTNLHGQYLEQCLYNVLDPQAYNELPELGCSGTYSLTGKFIAL
jgi:hypothetical protein